MTAFLIEWMCSLRLPPHSTTCLLVVHFRKLLLQSEFAKLDFLMLVESCFRFDITASSFWGSNHKPKDTKSAWEERFEVHKVNSLNLCAGLSPQ